MVQNIVGNGENAGNQRFLFSHNVFKSFDNRNRFQKLSLLESFNHGRGY